MKIDTHKDAIRYLESLIPDPKKVRHGNLRLERIEHLLKLIGNPHESFESVHIGGTAGKGSTAHITAALLKETGYKVGLHVSPHIEKINERIQANGHIITDKELVKLTRWLKPYVEQVGKEGKHGTPSYFEAIVALAFEYFKRKKVDIAVVEVGLGGTLDATNVLQPLVAIITNVHLDHTHILGNTVEKIARDKTGIIKKGTHIITAATQKSVLEIIKARCKAKNTASLTIVECLNFHSYEKKLRHPSRRQVRYVVTKNDLHGIEIDIHTPKNTYKKIRTTLLGAHQAPNIACAIAMTEALHEAGFTITERVIRKALKTVNIPARLELILSRFNLDRKIILDGAHNPVKMRALARALKSIFPKQKIIFIFAVKKTKDVKKMLKAITPIAKHIILTQFRKTTDYGTNASLSVNTLAKYMNAGHPYITKRTSHEALKYARKTAHKDDIICITGSLYLVGEVRSIIEK